MLEDTQYAKIKLLSYVKDMYNIPRFGHSKDSSHFFSLNKEESDDYTMGFIVVFALLMSIAALWFLILIVLRLLGHRVGCASGRPSTIPAESMRDKDGESLQTDETGEFIVMQVDQNRINRTRLIYFVTGVFAIATSGIGLFGIILTQQALGSMYDNFAEINTLYANLPSTVDKLQERSSEFEATKADLLVELNTFCITSQGQVNGESPSDVVADLRTALQAVEDINTDPQWEDIEELSQDTKELGDSFLDAFSFAKGPTAIWFLASTIGMSILIILIMFLLKCAWKSGQEGYEFVGDEKSTPCSKFLHFFVNPLFGLLVAGVWFLTSCYMSLSAVDADFCLDEITTGLGALKIVEEMGYDPNNEFYKLTDEFLHGCDDPNASAHSAVQEYGTEIAEAYNNALLLEQLFDDDFQAVVDACGASDNDGNLVKSKTTAVTLELDSLYHDTEDIFVATNCGTVAYLTQDTLYAKGCNSLPNSFMWSFIGLLSTAIFSTMLLSLRSATTRPQIYIVPPGPGDDSFDQADSFDERSSARGSTYGRSRSQKSWR